MDNRKKKAGKKIEKTASGKVVWTSKKRLGKKSKIGEKVCDAPWDNGRQDNEPG
ncbi:hypothetical protein HY995_02990 [Candidatus Micrarchaeota archaeon]|nr:hypothetical protein [Candidatus Micrarchaeota archaeon]